MHIVTKRTTRININQWSLNVQPCSQSAYQFLITYPPDLPRRCYPNLRDQPQINKLITQITQTVPGPCGQLRDDAGFRWSRRHNAKNHFIQYFVVKWPNSSVNSISLPSITEVIFESLYSMCHHYYTQDFFQDLSNPAPINHPAWYLLYAKF